MNKKNGIFISTPISGFADKETYLKYREVVVRLIEKLRRKYEVCSEVEQIIEWDTYDSPMKSVKEDFCSIKNNSFFILLHPARMQTCSLIEFGYACALKKKILIVGRKKDLPYLAVGYAEYSKEVNIIETDKLSDGDFERIIHAVDCLAKL